MCFMFLSALKCAGTPLYWFFVFDDTFKISYIKKDCLNKKLKVYSQIKKH